MRQVTIIWGAPVLAALALGGCSFGPKVPPRLYTLTAINGPVAGASASGRLEDAIVVLEPEAEQRLDVTRVPVQVDPQNVAYLKNAGWVERPARLMQRLLADTIRARGSRVVLDTADPEGGASVRLSGRLIDMGYDAPSSSVVVRYDAIRETPGGQITMRRFESIVPGVPSKPEPVGVALNQAANQVAADIAAWL